MSAVGLAAAVVVVLLGSAVQGGIGFGVNVVAAPVLAIVDPDFVPGPALLAAFVLTLLVVARDHSAIDRRGVGYNLAGRVPGTIAGAALLSSIPKTGVTIAVGGAVLLAVVLNVLHLPLRPNTPTLVTAGVVSGFSSTVSSVGGPPTAIVYANEPGPIARATLSLIFLVGSAMSIVTLVLFGELGWHEVRLALVLVAPALVGFLLSKHLAAHLDRGTTRHVVLAVALVGAVTAMAKALL